MEDVNYTVRYISDRGWRKIPNQIAPKTGAQLVQKSIFDIFEICNSLPDDKKKGEHGAIFTYDKSTVGKASVEYYDDLTTGGVVFVDIDHIPSALVDDIFNNFDEINRICNFAILGCQKSSSYYRRPGTADTGVHFFIASRACNGHDYVKFSSYALALVAFAIKKHLGKDVREFGADVLDTHSCKISQRIFLYHSDYKKGEFYIPITDETYELNSPILKKEYPELFKFEQYSSGEYTPVDCSGMIVSVDGVTRKIQLDYKKECLIANYLSSVGMKPDEILAVMLKIDSRDTTAYMRKHGMSLEKHFRQIIQTARGRSVSVTGKTIAENLLSGCGVSIVDSTITKQEENRITKIEMGDEEWMSDYVDIIENHISKEQILTISAPTGTGKTTMLKSITEKYHKNATILVPFNVTNNLYRWSNIVSSEDESSIYKKGMVNTMIWDQFVKWYNVIEQGSDILFVDESHALFFDRTYRDAGINVWGRFETWVQLGKKIVFVSATPAGEIAKLNSRVLKFTKKDHRDVKVNIIHTTDTFTSLVHDIKSTDYGRVCVFADRDVGMLWGGICSDGKMFDAKIYHSKWPKNMDELKTTEMLTARVNLFTRIAYNGLNFRNKNEKILISVRYTRGETTVNEIIQIIGRFRNNKDITINIYNDNKYASDRDLDELFEDAEAITNCEDISILRSEYYERLSKIPVQDAMREVKAYNGVWTLRRIIGVLERMYPVNVVEKTETFEKEQIIKRNNKLKKQASDLMVKWMAEEISSEEFHTVYTGTDMKIFIDEWVYDWMTLKMGVGEKSKLLDIVLEELKKPNRQVEGVINEIKLIIQIISMTEEQWEQELKSWEELKTIIHSKDTIKWAMAKFKKCTKIREKYAEFINNGSVQEEQYDVEGLFEKMLEDVRGEVQETMKKRSKVSKKPRKKQLFKSVETGEMKTKKEWCKKLKCDMNKFDYLKRKDLYIKV